MPSITSPVGYRRKEDLSSSPRIKSGEPSNCSTSEERKKSIHLLMFQIPMSIRGSFNSTATCGVHYFTLVPTGKVTDRHQMSKLVKDVEPVTGNVSEFSHSEPQLLWGSREVLVLWKPPWDRICLSERLLLFPSNTAELAGLALPKHYIAGKNLQKTSELGEPSFLSVRNRSCTWLKHLQQAKLIFTRHSLKDETWHFFGEAKVWEVFTVTQMCQLAT